MQKYPIDISVLRKAGLTESQAKGYLALITNGTLTPAELAKETGETRTNAYALCDKLVRYGLATKTNSKKVMYSANHPSVLEELAEKRRKIVQNNEKVVRQNIGTLIDFYYEMREAPGTLVESGRDGIERVYNDILEDKQPLQILRSAHDTGYMSHEYYKEYALRRAKSGVKTTILALATDEVLARQTPTYDKDRGISKRYWIKPSDYTARVEWSVYGDKVTALTFGEEPIALTIYSKDIAESMRQVFGLIKKSATLSKYSSRDDEDNGDDN